MRWVLATAWVLVRASRGRAALTAGGVAAAALVLGVTLTVAGGLHGGFERSAQTANLPSVIARFDDEDRADVDARVSRLPNLAARSYRLEITSVPLAGGGQRLRQGVVHVVDDGRRGYRVVAGRDVGDDPGEVVLEQGLARAWNLGVGDALTVGRGAPSTVVGIAVGPDNVAFPLARARVYVSQRGLRSQLPPDVRLPVNLVQLWAADEARADVLISFARQSAYGLSSVRFVSRAGIGDTVSAAAGVVVALLIAFAAVAAGLSGVLLSAGAFADVQRRLPALGVQRTIGLTPTRLAAVAATQAALIAAPAAITGLALGGVLAASRTDEVLAALNQLAPTAWSRVGTLLAAWLGVVALVAATATWPAWRAARRPPARLLRGAEIHAAHRAGRRGGLAMLGARLVSARRARFAAVVAVIASAAGVVLLLVALASLLEQLRDDPATLGKRYSLTARLPADQAGAVAALPGVMAAAARYETQATSTTALGSPMRLIAYPGDHTRFEAPALDAGRRLRTAGEAEVGRGLADALGLRTGSPLFLQADGGAEIRVRVVGIVRALQDEGRVAYVRPDRLLAAGARLSGPIAVRLRPGADRASVVARLQALGARPQSVGGATSDSRGLLSVLAALLRLVAITVAGVCLFALVQTLVLTVRERRAAVAVLRAQGAGPRALGRLLTGGALAVALPAGVVAALLERFALSPATAQLTAGYADLPLGASGAQAGDVAAALAALGVLAALLVARRLAAEPVVTGLRAAS